MSRFPD